MFGFCFVFLGWVWWRRRRVSLLFLDNLGHHFFYPKSSHRWADAVRCTMKGWSVPCCRRRNARLEGNVPNQGGEGKERKPSIFLLPSCRLLLPINEFIIHHIHPFLGREKQLITIKGGMTVVCSSGGKLPSSSRQNTRTTMHAMPPRHDKNGHT